MDKYCKPLKEKILDGITRHLREESGLWHSHCGVDSLCEEDQGQPTGEERDEMKIKSEIKAGAFVWND
jgi:hypothetical protein